LKAGYNKKCPQCQRVTSVNQGLACKVAEYCANTGWVE